MVKIVRHCQAKATETDRLDLNYFAPSLYSAALNNRKEVIKDVYST